MRTGSFSGSVSSPRLSFREGCMYGASRTAPNIFLWAVLLPVVSKSAERYSAVHCMSRSRCSCIVSPIVDRSSFPPPWFVSVARSGSCPGLQPLLNPCCSGRRSFDTEKNNREKPKKKSTSASRPIPSPSHHAATGSKGSGQPLQPGLFAQSRARPRSPRGCPQLRGCTAPARARLRTGGISPLR